MTKNHIHYNDESVYQSARAMAPVHSAVLSRVLRMVVTCTPAACAVAVLAYVFG